MIRVPAIAGLLGLAALAPAPALAVGTRPGPAPRAELIAYQRAVAMPGAPSTIWIMSGDGGGRREISRTPPGASDAAPSLSLSSGIVVWQRSANGGPPQLYEGDVFGDEPQPLATFPGGATEPSISHRLDVVASVGVGGDCELWLLPSEGAPRRLTDHGGSPGCDAAPAWARDGRRVVFRRTPHDAAGAPQPPQLLVLDVRTGALRPLDPALGTAAFAWAPGRSLLVLDHGELAAQGLDGQGRRVLASGPGLEGPIAWAPQAAYAAVTQRQPDGSTDIATLPGSGGVPTAVTRTPGIDESHPSWAYPSNQGNGVGPGVHAHSVRARRHHRHHRHRRHRHR